jgi:hypothetical protein
MLRLLPVVFVPSRNLPQVGGHVFLGKNRWKGLDQGIALILRDIRLLIVSEDRSETIGRDGLCGEGGIHGVTLGERMGA